MNDLKMKNYVELRHYVSRMNNHYHNDISRSLYQVTTYIIAAELARRHNCSFIIDLGCGTAYKMAKLYPEFTPIGIDFNNNLAIAKQTYPHLLFIDINFESHATNCQLIKVIESKIGLNVLQKSIVISADVIEHIRHPQECFLHTVHFLLKYVAAVVMSTPDRIHMYGEDHPGPPANVAHVREHTLPELELMLVDNQIYPTLGGYICPLFGFCKGRHMTSHSNYSSYHTTLVTLYNSDVQKAWTMSTQKSIQIMAFVIIQPNTRINVLNYNINYLSKQYITIFLFSFIQNIKIEKSLNIHYVSSLVEVQNIIKLLIQSTNFGTNDWFIIMDGHEVITPLRDPYLGHVRSLRDVIEHVAQDNKYDSLEVSSVFLQDTLGRTWQCPFKIHGAGPWDNGEFTNYKHFFEPDHNLKVWKNTYRSQQDIQFETTATNEGFDIIYSLKFKHIHVYPHNIVGWRTHPQSTTLDDSIILDLELQNFYTYELAFLFCSYDRKHLLYQPWIY